MTSSDIHIKQPKTFEEQVGILRERNLIIDDTEEALNFLKKVNDYRLSAYGLTLKQSNHKDLYKNGVTFKQLQMIYYFDKKLRELLIYYLESVEIEFRTKIAYYHAHDYGSLGYKESKNFKSSEHHKGFLKKLEKGIKQSSKELFVMHHESKYAGLFPFWVSIEVLSFGELSRLFRNLMRTSQIKIIQDFKDSPFTVVSWLHFLSYVRNVSAHYGRLYGKKFVIKPSLKDYEGYRIKNDAAFAVVFVLTKLLHHNDRQNFVIGLEALLEEYSEYIELKEVGFPSQWKEILYREG